MFFSLVFYSRWTPGKDFTDGRHDCKANGIWIQHGWIGDDRWFINDHKEKKIAYFRNPKEVHRLAALLRQHNITDVFPHLCPTSTGGEIPSIDPEQAELFLKIFDGFRVMPWVGGVLGVQAFPERPEWKKNFVESIRRLLTAYPEFAGIHINIEPCPSGNKDFLALLDEIRKALPKGKILSVAAFPPPTLWQPFSDVHWDRDYYNEVAQRSDQIIVMMYDTAIDFEKVYQFLLSRWTQKILDWSEGTNVLLGLPVYEDKNVGYHNPCVENLKNALSGVHAGLSKHKTLPKNYQGIALYCEWEMDKDEWEMLKKHFLRSGQRFKNDNPGY